MCASLISHTIGLPAIIKFGPEALKHKVVPLVLAREKIAALAVTEPGAGSDVANLRTSARRDGDYFVVDGEKAFITSGMRADYLTVAVRTGGPGRGGISLLLCRGHDVRPVANAAAQDGMVGLRHGDTAIRQLPGAGRASDRWWKARHSAASP